MRIFTAALLVVAAVILALVVTGFVPPPREAPAYSQQEIEEFNAHMLDLTWDAMELEGVASRPPNPTGAVAKPNEDFYGNCFRSSRMPMENFTVDPLAGYYLNNGEVPADVRLAFFDCLSQKLISPSGFVLSDEQLHYLFDYYQRWLVPCFVAQGADTGPIPDWDRYTRDNGRWNPYNTGKVDLEGDTFDRLVAACGPSTGNFPLGFDDGTGAPID